MRPPLRTTHTVAELEVTQAAYDEIRNRLTAVRYDHCFMEDGTIDMSGIGLTRGPAGRPGNIWPVVLIVLSMAGAASLVGLIVRFCVG